MLKNFTAAIYQPTLETDARVGEYELASWPISGARSRSSRHQEKPRAFESRRLSISINFEFALRVILNVAGVSC
jgi:hypothetical protein